MPDTPGFIDAPDFMNTGRPDVPDLVVPRGVTPFFLPGRPVRGRLVRLGALADALLTRHDNHPAVTRLAGQALALVAVLGAALKFKGSFSLQAKGDGPVGMLLADCTDAGELRGYARADGDRLAELLAAGERPSARDLVGDGYLAFTVDQGPDTERHQGIVSIEGADLSDMALHYFETSEQLRTLVHLACERTDAGWRAGALILEKIAGEGGLDEQGRTGVGGPDEAAHEEAWRTATALAATLTDDELLDERITPERLLHRLFHTEGVDADLSRALSYGCRCTRAKLSNILEGFGSEDLDHMAVGRDIVMTCEFCNMDFRFARESVRGLEAGAPE